MIDVDMTTIHIPDYPRVWDESWRENGRVIDEPEIIDAVTRWTMTAHHLVRTLYNEVLVNDPLWHFFLEPDIIIRCGPVSVLALEQRLLRAEIKYRTYPYRDAGALTDGSYGEDHLGIVARHPELLLPIFHAHSVAALTLDEYDFFAYLERVMHCAANPRWNLQKREDEMFDQLARIRAKYGRD